MTAQQRTYYNDQQFAYVFHCSSITDSADHHSALKVTLVAQGLGPSALDFLRSIYDTQPELGNRLRTPRPSSDTTAEFS